ncbi:MAG: outer membrane protein assembly factor [Bacteroidota bacterium]
MNLRFSAKYLLPILLCVFFQKDTLYAQQRGQYELVSIEFRGNESFSDSQLEEIIVSKRTPNWFYKFIHRISSSMGREAEYFDSVKIRDDIKALKNYYMDNGYFQLNVQYRYRLRKDEHEADLIYTISEGERYRISSYRYDGIERLDITPRLNRINDIDTTEYFSKELVEKNRQEVRTYLQDHGYMLTTLKKPDVFIDTSRKTVDVKVGFIPGNRYRISDIRVSKSGNARDQVDDELIIKLTSIDKNDFYSLDEINRAQVRLFNTTMFSSVLVNSVIEDTSGNYVPLNVSADIPSLRELSPELIINNQENTPNVGIGAQYSKKNFFGNARLFTLSGNFVVQDVFNVDYGNLSKFLALGDTTFLGYFDTRAKISQPYLFNKKVTSTFEGYVTINKQRQYKATIYGGKLSFDFELPRWVFMNSLVTYYNVERSVHDYQPDYLKKRLSSGQSDSLAEVIGRVRKKDFSSIIGMEVSAMQTDNLLFPTKGYTLSFTLEEANSIPNIIARVFGSRSNENSQFYRIIAKSTYYPKVYSSEKNAFGMKLRLGYAQVYSGRKDDIPLNQRFTAGGSNSVRGWNSRDLIPKRSIDLTNLSSQDFISYVLRQVPVGGTFLLEGSVETRNRIIGAFGGALFADFGNTWDRISDFRIDKIAVAMGFGIRYYSPFAPIRLDLGFKAYDPYDGKNLFQKFRNSRVIDNIQFHVGIGEAF